MSGSYFTVPFEMGKVVVQQGVSGTITAIHFDLDGSYDEACSRSKFASDIKRYFKGERVNWHLEPDNPSKSHSAPFCESIKLGLEGETNFRRRVYAKVADIPYGQTATYGEIASDIGCQGGARAVGQAMATNSFPLVVPCHRVLAARGGLGGFSSGLELKRYLLCLEGVVI
jgi:O-6-methylguanine DNA methyltransferase